VILPGTHCQHERKTYSSGAQRTIAIPHTNSNIEEHAIYLFQGRTRKNSYCEPQIHIPGAYKHTQLKKKHRMSHQGLRRPRYGSRRTAQAPIARLDKSFPTDLRETDGFVKVRRDPPVAVTRVPGTCSKARPPLAQGHARVRPTKTNSNISNNNNMLIRTIIKRDRPCKPMTNRFGPLSY